MEIKLHRSVKIIAIITIIFCLFFLYLRFIETKGLKVKEYKIVSSNITNDYHGLKIVHFSDIHYKTTIKYSDLEKIVEKINYINPDIVVFTGDIFDKKLTYSDNDIKSLIKIFSSINASYKKYAIIGDNDTQENYKKIIGNSGFVDLNNNYELIYNKSKQPILIAGISSGTTNVNNKLINVQEYLLSNEADQIYSILLMHEPDSIKYTDSFDLVLAGHSLNGQIKLPFIGGIRKMNGAKTYYDEYYKVNNTNLYISGGLGSTTVNLRFLNKPSINFYRITNK